MAIKLLQKSFFAHNTMNDLSTLKRIGDNELASIINFDYVPSAEGAVHIEMRGGTSKDTMSTNLTSGTQIQGIHAANFTGGTETLFVYNNIIYKLAATPTNLYSTGVADSMYDFEMFQDTLIMTNVTDAPLKYTSGGAVADLGGTPPTGAYVHVWHNFCFISGISANKNRLRWSDIGTPETWSAGNVQDLDYGEITGINSLGDNLYIFFRNKIVQMTGYTTATFQFNDFADIGCISHYGIVSNGTTLFFPSVDGIYAIGQLAATDRSVGGISLVKISEEKIRTFWDSLDLSTLGLIHGIDDKDGHKIRWTVRRSAASVNDRELIFDYDPKVLGFAVTEGRSISCYTSRVDASGNHLVSYGDSRTDANGGIIYALDTSTTDDGTAITGTIETKAYDFGRPDLPKKWQTVDILARGTANLTDVDVSYGVGEFPAYSMNKIFVTEALPVYDTAVYGVDKYADATFINHRIGIRKIGEALVMKMVCDTSGKKIRIAGWTINAQALNKKLTTTV